MANAHAETETNMEGIVALLVVFLLVVVFVAQSGLLSESGTNAELREPGVAEVQSQTLKS